MPAHLSRRDTILSAGLLIAGTALAPAHAAMSRAEIADDANRFKVYARVRGGAKGATALWWISGIIYAKIKGDVAKPLFRVLGASQNTITMRADGGLSQTMEEAGYFADLNTGAIMARWTNPITGAPSTPEPYKMKSMQAIAKDGTVERPNAPFPITAYGGIGAATVNGDTVWIEENFSARVGLLSPSVEGRKPEVIAGQFRVIDSLATFQARMDDVMLGDDQFVPATLAFIETDPWFPWMNMGATDGLQLWQLKGRKLRNADELPPDLRARLKADYPDFI